MHHILRSLAFILPLGSMITGCASGDTATLHRPEYITGDLGTLTYHAVDLVVAATPAITKNTPLVVTSLSDIQNLDQSSALGNLVADMIRSRLVQDGYSTSELRTRTTIALRKDGGEFMLARDSDKILPPKSVAAVLTGSYTAAGEKVYISLKCISVSDGHILAGVDYVVPHANVVDLLSPRGS